MTVVYDDTTRIKEAVSSNYWDAPYNQMGSTCRPTEHKHRRTCITNDFFKVKFNYKRINITTKTRFRMLKT